MPAVTVEFDESDRGPRTRLARGSGELKLDRGRGAYGEYQIVRPIARGGMAGVYLATHAPSGRRVALKVLDAELAGHPDLVARLEAEATLAARAAHPNVVAIDGCARTAGDVPYLVMEYLEGAALASIVEAADVPLADALAIGAQVAAALVALHAAGIVHCDVKSDNIVVLDTPGADGRPRAKLVDFGVARTLDHAVADDGIAGTPWCMAPEQWRGAPEPASDVYALGCVLFQLITGHIPFDGSLPELMTAHLERRPARLAWLAREPLPPELERLIARALAKAPAHRPTMLELATALAALADLAWGSVQVGFDDRDAPRARAI